LNDGKTTMMSMEEESELLQDFLVDAGEILEQLVQQVVDLEKYPDDKETINAVFRGFHTIKGGASFLALDPLVALCHRTEDVFNLLRNGERAVDDEVMDVVLPVIDVLKEQFNELSSGQPPREADAWILEKLDELTTPPGKIMVANDPPTRKKHNTQISSKKKKKKKKTATSKDEPRASVKQKVNVVSVPKNREDVPSGDEEEITDSEFDSLLDQFQSERKGIARGDQLAPANNSNQPARAPIPEGKGDRNNKGEQADDNLVDEDYISEEEFDALLDSLNSSTSKPQARSAQATASAPAPADKTALSSRSSNATETSSATNSESAAVTASKAESSANQSAAKIKPRELSQAETSVRVDTKRLDDIMNLVGELVLVRNRMTSIEGTLQSEEVSKVVGNLDLVTADLQSAVMKTRMQPIKKVFGRFPRVVRDLARSLKKEVSLELQGEDTDLDKNLVEALADPLVHLVRNAVDHGIESPEVREANGKPRTGTVILTAEQEGDHILLTIEDDGKGMDADKIRALAVEKGLLDEESAARLENKECYNLIFLPGFSTKSEISDVSGRGVGMDVVKNRIEQLNGTVEVDSETGYGSKIIIKVPLTLAIMPTLMVTLGAQIFALPLASVNEIFNLDLTRTSVLNGQRVVMVRSKALPLFYLRHWLVKGEEDTPLPEEGHVVVVSMGVQRIGFVVDQLIGQEEVVIKPLGAILHGMKGLAGATITGDGRISLILDIPGLMQTYARRF
jgi:two-component system chemotaxis sensor kinase CheA